jgi:hypothetical protein
MRTRAALASWLNAFMRIESLQPPRNDPGAGEQPGSSWDVSAGVCDTLGYQRRVRTVPIQIAYSNVIPIRRSFRQAKWHGRLNCSVGIIRVKRSGMWSGVIISRAASVADMLHTGQSIAPPPNAIDPAFRTRWHSAARCSSLDPTIRAGHKPDGPYDGAVLIALGLDEFRKRHGFLRGLTTRLERIICSNCCRRSYQERCPATPMTVSIIG